MKTTVLIIELEEGVHKLAGGLGKSATAVRS